MIHQQKVKELQPSSAPLHTNHNEVKQTGEFGAAVGDNARSKSGTET
jgi:hypothetical protein